MGSPPSTLPAHRASVGLRTIAGYEAAKGALVLLAGLGLLGLIHRDVQEAGEELVRHFHLSPSSHYPRIFLELTARVTDGWLWGLALGSLVYAALRFAEAYGLWHGKAWAEWLGAVSGAIYVPFEAVELYRKFTALRIASLLVNLLVVGYLLSLLRRPTRTADGALGRWWASARSQRPFARKGESEIVRKKG
jgi:uncharacterized membrane protein (DUF2068 family)